MSTALEHVRPVATPGRVGQGTAVEQSRAIAEVQAQVIVAQQMPRNVDLAVSEALRSCGHRSLAEKAFYRYPRGGTQVTGESITLAKELARCWGNIQYGIAELRRDDDAGESEMMAFAWDVQTNARPSTTFIVPHVLDTTNGRKHLRDVRDIYENNSNMGARRMREMIFNVLPPWLIEDAKAACYATLAADDRDGSTLAERAATAVDRFARIGIRADQLVRKIGAPQNRWSAGDLGQLAVIWRSIERGESSADAEFGIAAPAVTAADVTGQQPDGQVKRGRAAAKPKTGQPADVPPDDAPWPDGAQGRPCPEALHDPGDGSLNRCQLPGGHEGRHKSGVITWPGPDGQQQAGRKRRAAPGEAADRPTGAAPAAASGEGSASAAPVPATTAPPAERPPALAATGQVGMIRDRFTKLGYSESGDDRASRLRATQKLARREAPIGSTKELTQDEAKQVLRALDRCKDAAALAALLEDGTVPGE